MEFFDQAVEFFKEKASIFAPTTYKIGGMTIVQDGIISEGGYGYVYRAHDKVTNKQYALKTINVQDSENEEAVMREIDLWAKLGKHRNICEYRFVLLEGFKVIKLYFILLLTRKMFSK